MDKWELIEITLDELIMQWQNADRNLFYTDYDAGDELYDHKYKELTITWEPEEPTTDHQKGQSISTDSMRIRKGVTISYHKGSKEFRCLIHTANASKNGHFRASDIETSICAKKRFAQVRSLYRKFIKLRNDINNHQINKNNVEYISNLCKVFPGTLDDQILGDDSGDKKE